MSVIAYRSLATREDPFRGLTDFYTGEWLNVYACCRATASRMIRMGALAFRELGEWHCPECGLIWSWPADKDPWEVRPPWELQT